MRTEPGSTAGFRLFYVVPLSFFCVLFGVLRGRFQYGLLHFGQTRGSPAVSCFGTQVWPHRSQRQPLRVIFAIV
jgi:hypothetical protein